jgi:hypothetical protein
VSFGRILALTRSEWKQKKIVIDLSYTPPSLLPTI